MIYRLLKISLQLYSNRIAQSKIHKSCQNYTILCSIKLSAVSRMQSSTDLGTQPSTDFALPLSTASQLQARQRSHGELAGTRRPHEQSKFGNSLRGTFCESVGLFVRRIFAMSIIATGPLSHVPMNLCPLAFELVMARICKSARSRTSKTPKDICGHPGMFPFIIFLIILMDEEKLELMTGPKIPVGLITANSRLPPSSLQNFQADFSASVLLL